MASQLLHTSNTVFEKCAPPSGFWPLHLVFGPPAAKSWRRACLNTPEVARFSDAYLTAFPCLPELLHYAMFTFRLHDTNIKI